MLKVGFAFLLIGLLAGCSSVTVRTDDGKKDREPPDYQQRFNYLWWGLKGEHSVNVRLICQGRPVKQMQSVNTLGDSLLGAITIGIYSPRTARVWCEKGDQDV